ncbi:MAG: putative Ig domain-containing protein [Chiayiivirga sp.]|uniref:putative Ig domain-containing protein n=1 Tax=Chiayiivirga sp. TaxID=2041042 RepID=UPI0025BC244B|nr:putative Ig domain-containing protein [Chiayiivirga sp.]MCI1729368.1 putative Ig domain-containing protein [Chiayiivirga sp.]
MTRNIAQLAPGEARVYTLTRKVDATTETSAPAMVAAFVDPSNTVDDDQADNKRKLFLRLVANGLPSADPKTISTSEDVAAIVTLSGTDPDPGDTVVAWNVVTPPQHGSLSGTAPNLTYTPAMDYNGADSFTYRVVDNRGGQGAPATVSITISAVNDAPRIATQMADVTYAETAAVEINAANAFVDPEGDAFTVAASGLPSGVSYFAGLKVITGTLNQTSAGTYNVVLTATETASGLTANNTFTLTVTDTNQTPTVATPIPDQASNEGATPSLDVAGNFSDADANNTLTFSVTAGALPPGLTLATNGQITGTISQTAAVGSPYSITVTANDGNGGTVSDTFAWTVNAANVAPVAGTLADRMGTENDLLEILGADLRAAFSDPDDPTEPFHDTLSFSVSGLPAGLIYFPTSSNILGMPAYGTDGIHVITVTATDPGSLTASQTFQLTIGNANRLPTVANAIPNQAATVANAFSFQFASNTFSDPDTVEATTPDVLVYSAQLGGGGALPGWLTFTPATRSFSGTPTVDGTVTIEVTADDGHGGTVTDSFDIVVAP